MIDLNKYYISSVYQGASGGSEGRSGFVPKALSGDELRFLRGDGTWQEVATNVQTMIGATSSTDGQAGLVPQPLSGDSTKYLRGDGTWQNIEVPVSNIQYIVGEPIIDLDVSQYDTFVIGVTGSTTVTYSNFVPGKSINVYLSALHISYVPHTFPENTLFAELGDENIIYSFAGYTTRILLQNTGNFIINFSSVVKNLTQGGEGGSGSGEGSGSGYYGVGGGVGIGLDLLDLFLEELF